jgi:hypothetical protein
MKVKLPGKDYPSNIDVYYTGLLIGPEQSEAENLADSSPQSSSDNLSNLSKRTKQRRIGMIIILLLVITTALAVFLVSLNPTTRTIGPFHQSKTRLLQHRLP